MARRVPYDGHMLWMDCAIGSDNSLLVVFEETKPFRVMFMRADPDGANWSKPVQLMPATPNLEVPSIFARGKTILVTAEQTHQDPLTNGPLGYFVVSKDGGKTWR